MFLNFFVQLNTEIFAEISQNKTKQSVLVAVSVQFIILLCPLKALRLIFIDNKLHKLHILLYFHIND